MYRYINEKIHEYKTYARANFGKSQHFAACHAPVITRLIDR